MSVSDELKGRLETLLGHLSSEDFSVALTQRVEPSDTEAGPPPDFEIPVLDPDNRLELGETLGQGGAGIVQLAVQKSLNRSVAVKRLRPDRALDGSEVGLWREAWIGGLLAHPNIVAIYDLDVDAAGKPAIVCQHVDGEPWTKSLESDFENGRHLEPAVLERHLRILMHICDAVAFAHDRGFLHRDLKPDNVMLGKFGEVYLIDWGIALALDGRYGNRFPTSDEVESISGTPCYMPPESMRDSDDDELYVGIPTDVYLLGGVLHQILCGRPPHLVRKIDEMLESIRISKFEFPPNVPKEISEICSKALAREPSARYQTATELGAALSDFLAKQRARAVLGEADEKLARLNALFREETTEGEARFELYRLFSECKFGYSTVVDVLGSEARQGIAAAAETMVAYELDRGDPDAAEALLAEVDEVSAPVAASIAEARQLKHAELETLKSYAAVGRSHDARRGLRARFFLGCLGVLLVLAGPIIRLYGYYAGVSVNEPQQIATAAFALIAFGGVALFFRRALSRHAVTRAATMVFMSVGLVHTLLGISAYMAGVDASIMRIINCYVIAMGCIVFGWLFERGMMWSGAVFCVAGLVISSNPDDLVMRNLLILGSGLFFAANALVVWGPRSRVAYKRAASQSDT